MVVDPDRLLDGLARLGLYPIEFLFCSLPGAGFSRNPAAVR